MPKANQKTVCSDPWQGT